MRAVILNVMGKEFFSGEDSIGFLNELEIGVTSNILGQFGNGRNPHQIEPESSQSRPKRQKPHINKAG
ncbi:MAG: hypothetical protein RJQ09_14890 [Cyclobacteriaceae bacterium]